MTIKARLTLAVVLLLVALTAVLGVVAVRSTRASMLDVVDQRLVSIAQRPPALRAAPPAPDVIDENRYREIGVYLYSPRGVLLVAQPAGFASDPEPPPDIPDPASDKFRSLAGRLVTLPATSDDLDYRVFVAQVRNGRFQVLAEPLRDIDDAVASLTRTFLIAGLAVVAIGAAISWVVIRRGLRPVDRMIDTASEIAAGDMSSRVDHHDNGTELGRLAHALNDMLARLEAAFDERAAAQARLERFVADASHELRTPVTTIRGYAELYRRGGLSDPANLDRAMTRIEQESERMGALVEDLVLLARLDEHLPLERERVDLVVLATDAAADLRAIEPERPVVLHTPVGTTDGAGDAVVLGDEQRIRQVLANLLTNARVHTPMRTPVDITVERVGDRVRIVVADAGPGIAPEDQARIFERFYRTDRSRSRERGGTGLGLSIVAAVVAAHDGTVRVNSTPGRGATFTVELPAADRATGDDAPTR